MQDPSPHALVVDDDALILMHACDILEDAGYNCLSAQDGISAWSVIKDHGPRIVLLFSDIEMPGMNGLELAAKVAEQYPHIEVVLASGRVQPDPDTLPENASFIGKPFCAEIVQEHLLATLPEPKLPPALRDDAT